MGEIEWKLITPDEVVRDIEDSVKLHRENKYAFQIGLKDLDFAINTDLLNILGLRLPLAGVQQVEYALSNQAITPELFTEEDSTQHIVLIFDHRPVGFSGFMNCVTHSLALTNHGLLEVGRYPAMQMNSHTRNWGWFIHRRFATPDELNDLCTERSIAQEQFMQEFYQVSTDG